MAATFTNIVIRKGAIDKKEGIYQHKQITLVPGKINYLKFVEHPLHGEPPTVCYMVDTWVYCAQKYQRLVNKSSFMIGRKIG